MYGENLQQKPNRKRKNKCVNTVSDVIMKQCREVLRLAATADEKMVFSSLLAGSLNSSDNDDGGLLQSPSMLSLPLDFRTIDMKLTSGVYGGSHDAFLADVREVCSLMLNLFCFLIFNIIIHFFLKKNSCYCLILSLYAVLLYLNVERTCFRSYMKLIPNAQL